MIYVLTLLNLLRRINKEKLIIHNNEKKTIPYNMVNPIFRSLPLQDNTLYVGFVSELDNLCCENSNAGFILIPDVPLKENVAIAGEFVLWDELIPFELLFNNIQAEFRRKIDLASNMSSIFSALIKGNSLKELIDIGTKILGNPIIVTNSAYKILAMSDIDVDDPFWQFVKTHGYCSQKSINKYKHEGIAKKVCESEAPILLTKGMENEKQIISKRLSVENKIIGYIGVHGINKKFTTSDLDTINILSDIISIEMKNDLYEEGLTHTAHEDILIDLLNNEIPTTSILKNRLKGANWSLKKYFCLIKIPLSESDHSIWLFDYFYTKLINRAILSKVAKYHNSLVILMNYDTQTEYDKELNNIIDILKNNSIKGGISSVFTKLDLAYLNIYYYHASKAYEIGKITNKSSTSIYRYEDIALFHLFSKIQNKDDLKMFCHPAYSELLKYDKLNGTEYCNSLYEYILCANNVSAAAKKLFIHRNTMSYRVNKISEITGLDLTNGRDIYKLYMAIRINEWLNL